MRVLVVGAGGREHAIVRALNNSRSVTEIHGAPGNPGIAALASCHPVAVSDLPGLVDLADRIRADLVVVGPEAPLAAGLADLLAERKIAVFGPTSGGARLEASKRFAKNLMREAGIPTAAARYFQDLDDALRYIDDLDGPVVIKADGLAAGKGVTVCDGPDDARAALVTAMKQLRFGDAGASVLVEERMEGEELSILGLCDGKTVLALPAAQDFKRAYDGDTGPNTGGMGSYSPVPACTPEIFRQANDAILEPAAEWLRAMGTHYVGVIYAGLMLTARGLKVVEFNCRFGDPEAQAILPRLRSDLGELMAACTQGALSGMRIESSNRACVCVVAASGGYPENDRLATGFPISGVPLTPALQDVEVFQAATAVKNGRLVTAGGRVLGVSALGDGIAEARARAYEALCGIGFEGMRFRRDIGLRAVQQSR